jgi:hypothetical protein
VAPPPPMLWIGTVPFDVTSPGGSPIGRLELAVTTEHVEVTYQGRLLGQVPRPKLRRWLRQPRDPLRFEEVRLVAYGRNVYVSLGLAPPSLMPTDVAAYLRAVV